MNLVNWIKSRLLFGFFALKPLSVANRGNAMNEARGVTRPPLPEDVLARMREAHKHDSFLEGCQIALEGRENQLTASLEREAELREQLAAAQNAALTRENEQSAMDAATVEERFELREQNGMLKHTIGVLSGKLAKSYYDLQENSRSVDEIVTSLYRRFKDWSNRGFGPEDVTWCEVKADVLAIIAELAKEKANG
jgi:hypothetical protein